MWQLVCSRCLPYKNVYNAHERAFGDASSSYRGRKSLSTGGKTAVAVDLHARFFSPEVAQRISVRTTLNCVRVVLRRASYAYSRLARLVLRASASKILLHKKNCSDGGEYVDRTLELITERSLLLTEKGAS